jgi:stearoyl-CoA desaturase (delta-9 desaturase)
METSVDQILRNTRKLPQLWGVIVPSHIVAIIALFTVSIPVWWWVALLVGYVCLKMIGIAAGYHRLFCHRGYKVSRPIKLITLYFGVLAGQGSPIAWCSIHRGYHHRHADTPKDLHSPRDGFWHSYMAWMFKHVNISVRSTIDLQRDPDMLFTHKYYTYIIWTTHLLLVMISVQLWVFLLLLPSVITLHLFLLQTSVTHIPWMGYHNYIVKDDSVNSPWLFPLILGEAWHNNHHGEGRNPNYGGRRWWEIDPTFWLIQLIRTDKP